MKTLKQSVLALAAAGLMAGGCASGAGNMQTGSAADDRTVIAVTNNNWSDMTIYLLRSGMRQRLGTVTSQSTETFAIPTHLVTASGDVHLLADPVGSSQTFTSAPLLISPGQSAQWQLENSIALSSFWIR